MKKTRPCLQTTFALILSVAAQRAAAQTLSLSPTSIDSSISHQYGPMGRGHDAQSFTFGTPSVELVNYDTIQVSVNAPAGEMWNVAYDGQGLSSANLAFDLLYNNDFSEPWATVTGGSLQFNFVNGSSADLSGFGNDTTASMPASGDRFDLDQSYTVTGDFSFTGFTATLTYDNSTLASAALTGFFASDLTYQYQLSNHNASDPGALLTTVPIPEPSTLMLAALGGVVGLGFSGGLRLVGACFKNSSHQ